MASKASAATGGFPAALAAVFCVSMAWRTACRPPRRSCSATGICSGRSAPAWRCGARWTSARPGARRGPASRRARRVAGHRAGAARSAAGAVTSFAPVALGRRRLAPVLAGPRLASLRPRRSRRSAIVTVVAPALRRPGREDH